MNIADYVILGAIAVSMALSLMRGFVIEALSLTTWIAAFIIARLFSLPFAVLLTHYVNPPSARQPVAFIALFILTLIVGALIKHRPGAGHRVWRHPRRASGGGGAFHIVPDDPDAR